MGGVPRVLRRTHHRVQDLVVVAAAAQIPGQPARQLRARGTLVMLEEAKRAHDESRHAEGTLESLFVDHGPLNRMQISVGTREALNGHDLARTHGVCKYRTRITRHIVDENRTGAALGSIATKLRPGEAELVAERHRERLLHAHVDWAPPAVDVQRDEPLVHAALCE